MVYPPWWTSHPELGPETASLVQDWLDSGVIKWVPIHEVACASSIFPIGKRDTTELRLITNLRNINPFLVTTPFQLPTLREILPYLRPGMWASSIDIKSAYLHYPICARQKVFMF